MSGMQDSALVLYRMDSCGSEVYKEPLDLLLLPHIGIQPRSIGILVMQLRHLTLHGKIADHPVIFRLYLVLFDDCIGQCGILHLCGQI